MPILDAEYPQIEDGRGAVLLKRKTIARVIRLMRRGRARGGANTTEQVTDSGTFIHAQPGGEPTPPTPWEISVTGNATDGYFARVRPGTVTELVPWNIFNTFALAAATTYYVKLQCATDGKTPNLITVVVDTTPVDPVTLVAENAAPPTFFVVLGIIVTGAADVDTGVFSSAVFQIRTTNINATPVIDFLATRTPPAPGDEPFLRWYKWNIA